MSKLTMMDLFCGAGGISEGFRQMGFNVIWALDNWAPAVETHLKNHPDTEIVNSSIENVDPSTLPRPDVLVGGPPCTEFSYAKKGGKGNLMEGMRLVSHFLHFVEMLRPKYWIMENVPRLLQTLPQEVDLTNFGFKDSGTVSIPRRTILNAADYGAPQKRLRLISGNYPLPKQTHFETAGLDYYEGAKKWVPMRKVVDGLPNPLSKPKKGAKVRDPIYDFLELEEERLSGHFINTVMTDEEARENCKSKTDHSWYGRMKFPDDLDRPARTVMATQFRASRETMAIAVSVGGLTRYRAPTIRECASLQGFPITYQFWGKDFTTRIKQVGNAVPVNLSSALARAILESEGKPVPEIPFIKMDFEIPPEVEPKRTSKKAILTKKFRDHIPKSKVNGFRVDLDNMGDNPKIHPVSGKRHVREWVARLYVGSGKTYKSQAASPEDVIKELRHFLTTPENRGAFQSFVSELASELPKIPDATTLQAIRSGLVNGVEYTPYRIIDKVSKMVDRHFPEKIWRNVRIPPSGHIKILVNSGLSVRVAAALLAASYIAHVANKSDEWIFNNKEKYFVPQDWPKINLELKKPTFEANKYLSKTFPKFWHTR